MLFKAEPWSPFEEFCPLSSLSGIQRNCSPTAVSAEALGEMQLPAKPQQQQREEAAPPRREPLGVSGAGSLPWEQLSEEGTSIPEPVLEPWVPHLQMCTRAAGTGCSGADLGCHSEALLFYQLAWLFVPWPFPSPPQKCSSLWEMDL